MEVAGEDSFDLAPSEEIKDNISDKLAPSDSTRENNTRSLTPPNNSETHGDRSPTLSHSIGNTPLTDEDKQRDAPPAENTQPEKAAADSNDTEAEVRGNMMYLFCMIC